MRVSIETPSKRREADFLAAVARSRKLHRQLVTPPNTPEKYRQFVKSSQSSRHANFLVVEEPSRELAGVINIENIVRGYFKSAHLGYYAFVPYAGNGFMRQGLELVVEHGFKVLRLHRLEANIQPSNERSKALVKRLGFRLEGYSEKYLKISGRWRDHERWALLREEWTGRARSD